jgi:alcohol dehydrogenase YqhD (iron-dependent ADH family)
MWSATLALNGLTTAGIGSYGFPNHMIGHSLSAIYDIAHAHSLSIIFPAWLKYNFDGKKERIVQLGKAIFDERDAEVTINKIVSFFKSIDVPTSLSDANIDKKDIQMIAENAVALAKKWQLNDYTVEVIAKILQLAA